jgi:hypothetical protein
MKKFNKNHFIIIIIIIGFIVIVFNMISQPGAKDLKGNFKELAFVRNEQNDGPILRIYAVSLSEPHWEEMEHYGNYMPHNKYGNTKVYFFLENGVLPSQLKLGSNPFDTQYQQNCIGVYEKDGMGVITLKKYPFK